MILNTQMVTNAIPQDLLNTTFIFSKCLCIVLCLSLCFSKTVPFNYIQNYHVPRVVNGWPAELGDAPYQVALKSKVVNDQVQGRKLYRTFCGAVIVGPKKLITAAHCIQPTMERIYLILPHGGHVGQGQLRGKYAVAGNLKNYDVFSRNDSKINGQWRLLYNAYYPRNFRFPKHDIALALTRKPFYFNEYVAPIPVASTNIEYSGSCLVSGYGKIATGNKASRLLLAYLDIIPTSTCNKLHNRNMNMFVCTNSKVSDVAQGDSGGPLVCANTGDPNEGKKGLLVGIVSGHRPYAGSFFTRVSRYKRFLGNACSNFVNNCNILVYLVSLRISVIYETFFLF